MKSARLLVMVLALSWAAGGNARAELYSIRLVGSAQPDCWDLEEIVARVTENSSTDREKALALHKFGMAHMIHFIGPMEDRGAYVSDAMKILGVYGYCLCGDNSFAMCCLYNLAGLKARARFLKGHVVPEVWFENKWNYIDTDMFGYVHLDDGRTIASVDELIARPELFTRAVNPPDPYFPYDEKTAMASCFKVESSRKDYHPYATSHLMRLSLRTAESVTLYYRPQDRFYLAPQIVPREMSTQYRDYWVLGPVRASSLAWCDKPPAAYGNGLFEYAPNLRSDYFRLENPGLQGVRVNQGNRLPPLAAENKGVPASLTVEVASPWVIAGLQNDLTDFSDNTDGAVVSGLFWRMDSSDQNRILVSTDRGATWNKVWENPYLGAVPFRVDLTRHVNGLYGYLVRFEWVNNGTRNQVGLEDLKVRTWVELSPMALPRLQPGANTFSVSTDPHRAVSIESFWDRGENLPGQALDNLTASEKGAVLHPVDKNRPGALTFSLEELELVDLLKISFMVRALADDKIKDVRAELYLSQNSGASWDLLEKYAPEPEQDQNGMWFNHAVKDRTIYGKNSRVKISVFGGSLHKVAAACLVRVTPRFPSDLRVSHIYSDENGRQTVRWNFQSGGQQTTYEVKAPSKELVNEALKIEALPPDSK